MEKNVERYLEKRAEDIREEWRDGIEEQYNNELSPIEMLFLIEWEYQMMFEWTQIPVYYYDNRKIPFLYPQYEIEIKDIRNKSLKYRVDFLIIMKDLRNWDNLDAKKDMIIIEIDSHLWHGSTPEQFTKEKKRERDLISVGYNFIRFSGREIYRNPEKCVNEVIKYIIKKDKIS